MNEGPPTPAADGRERLSLILMNWKRPRMLERIVERYAAYGFVDDIIVWDNNPGEPLRLPRRPGLKVVSCRHDAGLDARWAAAAMADHAHLLVHDDDLLLSRPALLLLFKRYLRRPDLSHSLRGRGLGRHYEREEAYGPVDVALTNCLILNAAYIRPYFDCVAGFDDLRDHGCGNGEDIIMNFVVRRATGERNRAHFIGFEDATGDPAVGAHSLWGRPHHTMVRRAIARRCIESLLREPTALNPCLHGMDELRRRYPAAWQRYHREPAAMMSPGNFELSGEVDRRGFERTLRLLCRAPAARRGANRGEA